MLLKALVYYGVAISSYAVAGLEYQKYYGNGLFNILNATWTTGGALFPLDLIFDVVKERGNVTKSQCLTDLQEFRNALGASEPWSVQMADSSGGFLPGALSGNLINFGGFDECVSVKDVGPSAKYCWLRISINGSKDQTSSFLPHNVPIIHSLCVPDSCNATEIEDLISDKLLSATVVSNSVSCQERPQTWGSWEICGVIVFSLLILSSIFSTIYDKFWATNYEGYNELWCSFSLSRNIKALTKNQPNKFTCLDGLRVFSQCYVIIYHVCRDDLKNNVPVFNKFMFNKFLRSWEGMAFVCASYAVDTFTVIGGFLVMYSIMGKREKKTVISHHIFNRFMRIYPAYAFSLIMMLTLAGKLCDGPLCESMVFSRQDLCKEVWWTNVLCIHNIYPGLTKSCMSHTWYIAADWQLYVVLSPLLIIGIRDNKTVTTWAIVGTGLAAMLTVFLVTVFYNLNTETLIYERASQAKMYYDGVYTEPYTRIGPWCVGILFGMIMHNQKKNKITLKKEQVIFLWGLCCLIVATVILIDLPFQKEDYVYNGIKAGIYNSLARPLWAAAMCWIIFACSTGYAGIVNDILSASSLQVLGKLSYSAYLIHKLVINLYFSNLRGPIFISPIQQGTLFLGMIALSFMASVFLYLLCEIPFAHIGKFLLQNGKREEKDLQIGNEPSQPGTAVTSFDTLEMDYGRKPQIE